MKKINNINSLIAALAVVLMSAFSFSSCSSDDDAPSKPTISNLEIGSNNSHIAYIGDDLHVEGNIEAMGTINTVIVEIFQTGSATQLVNTTFTDYAGMKNAEFHKHIDIPATATAGTYTLRFTVTDAAGTQIMKEAEIEIRAQQ